MCTNGFCKMVIVTLLLGAMSSLAFAASPPEGVLLTSPGLTSTKPSVIFPHWEHNMQGIDCKTCHHTAKTKDKIVGCTSCHKDNSPGAREKAKGFYQAWHSKTSTRSCVGCHTAEAKKELESEKKLLAGAKKGLKSEEELLAKAMTDSVTCNDCHFNGKEDEKRGSSRDDDDYDRDKGRRSDHDDDDGDWDGRSRERDRSDW